MFKIGSLFDGAGTFPFAAKQFGVKPTWASEIEPFPVAVTTKRFPNMKHLGDITKINGAEIEPVDVITFGSPCQDLSVAGKREGLSGERSGLFMEAVRIIKEMRGVTNGKYPQLAIWENVPGAFSSNEREDFRVVLEELCKIKGSSTIVPRPPKRGGRSSWNDAGLILADGFSIAWRVLDAEFWGVPQRRRRIFLVADFGGQCAGEILFEREGLSRSFEESRKAWKGITHSLAYSLNAEMQNADTNSFNENKEGVISIENHPADSRMDMIKDGKVQTLTSRMGTGGGNVPIILSYNKDEETDIIRYDKFFVMGCDLYNQSSTGDISMTMCAKNGDYHHIPCVVFNTLQDAVPNDKVAPCLSTGNPNTGQSCLAVAIFGKGTRPHNKDEAQVWEESEIANCLNVNDISEVCVNEFIVMATQQGGAEIAANLCPTLTAAAGTSGNNQPVICYALDRSSFNQGINAQFDIGIDDSGIAQTLVAKGPGAVCYGVPLNFRAENTKLYKDTATTVCNGTNPGFHQGVLYLQNYELDLRRLTPTECGRLQGMPDWWCEDIPHYDNAEYKMWGNGMALPCVMYVMEGVVQVLSRRWLEELWEVSE